MRTLSVAFVSLLGLPLAAQANAVPGTDIAVFDVNGPGVFGRTGAAYPNGLVGMAIGHSMCNQGTVNLPWFGTSGGVMVETYPKIAFLLARESNGRMVQISGKSFLKHSRTAFNFSGTNPCGPCQSGPSQTFRMGCYDVYSSGFNGSQGNLGPTTEINPWLGSWNPVGSYFDIGDPAQTGYPAAADGVQSLSITGFGSVKNRMQVLEQDLVTPGTIYGQNQLVILGEPVANRGNNQISRPLSFTWSGSSWSVAVTGTASQGSVLTRWTGATTAMAGNGNDDGRFLVAVKVTGPVNGMWHYEYAVQNVDNHRGGAVFRIPVCAEARVENVGFHDIDSDALNDWTPVRNGDALEFLAGANNPLDWNTFYNVWFDSDAAPAAGLFEVDAARPGAGALTVAVPAQVPGLFNVAWLGAGCGAPAPTVVATGQPTIPNAAFGVEFSVTPGNLVIAAFGFAGANLPLGGGCFQYLDGNQLGVVELLVPNPADGKALRPIPLAAGMTPVDWFCQGFEVVDGGPLLGFLAPTNGLQLRVGGTGCP
ncbi:MAG: hypothetical protein JNL08_11415 [Planctomycetes bacterium]|nr:hypothetical protein [Planctomycetota bacterium]